MKYPDLFKYPHIFDEDEKIIYIPTPISGFPTVIGINQLAKKHFPEYKPVLVNRESFKDMGGKL